MTAQLSSLRVVVYALAATAAATACVLVSVIVYALLIPHEHNNGTGPSQAMPADAVVSDPPKPLEAVTNAQLGKDDIPSYPSHRPLSRRTPEPDWSTVIELHQQARILALKLYDVQVDCAKMKTELRELRARVNKQSAR